MLDDTSRRALATARILTLAFGLACVLYAVVGQMALASRQPLPKERLTVLVPALLVMAAMGLAASFFVGSAMRSRGGRSLNSWFVAVIVAQALREGAAVVGLVLTFLSGSLWPVRACAAAAILALAVGFPTESDLEDHLRG